MMREFGLRFSMPKLLGKFMSSLEIDSEEIELDAEEQKFREDLSKIQAGAGQEAPGPGQTPEDQTQPSELAAPEGAVVGSGAGTTSGG